MIAMWGLKKMISIYKASHTVHYIVLYHATFPTYSEWQGLTAPADSVTLSFGDTWGFDHWSVSV